MTDLILFSGQSNMQGQSDTLLPLEVPQAQEYRWLEDRLIPLQDPVGEDIRYDYTRGCVFDEKTPAPKWLEEHITGSSCYGHSSLVPAFCQGYTDAVGRKVVAAHIAKGSTCIHQWLPDTPAYDLLIKKASAAQKKVQPQRTFFVWLQGESDAIAGRSKEYYTQKLLLLEEALRKDLGIEAFGIIRVGRFTGDKRDDEIIAAQREICRLPRFLLLTEATETAAINPKVKGHFSAAGLQQIGREAGKALGAFAKSEY